MAGKYIAADVGNNPRTRTQTTETSLNSPSNQTDDGGFSRDQILADRNKHPTIDNNSDPNNKYSQLLYNNNNLYSRNYLTNHTFTHTFRFGTINPYGGISTGREYLFFTKPDLHINLMNDGGYVDSEILNPALDNFPFWQDLYMNRRNIVNSLQLSLNTLDPFNHLLSNRVSSNLDLPSLDADVMETPTNMYGVNYSYRGSSENKDDNPDFSLEFKDTRYLDIYYYFKAYEEYETLKHHGILAPCKYYITNKILHDQFCIYKFIVDEDMETLVYWGKMYGVFPTSLPRDVFSNPNWDNGLSYSINFKAAFYEDMKPEIIADFNNLSKPLYDACRYQIDVYNPATDNVDHRPARAAYIEQIFNTSKRDVNVKKSIIANNSPSGYIYKLRWRGDDQY